MPKKGQRFLQGLKRAGEEVTARTPGSAQRGIYVDAEDFERIKRLAGSPMSAENPADRDALLKAYETVTGIVGVAQIEAVDNPAEDDADTLQTAVDRVLEQSKSVSPRERSALIATISNQIDEAATRVTGEQAERIDSLKQRLQTEFQKTPNDPSSGLTPGKAVQAFDEQFQNIQARRTLQLPDGPPADASVRNPELATARPVPVAPRPVAQSTSSLPASPRFDEDSSSPEISYESPPRRRASPEPTPRPGASDAGSVSSGESVATQSPDRVRTVSTARDVERSTSAAPGAFASLGQLVTSVRNYVRSVPTDNDELASDVDVGLQDASKIHQRVIEEMDSDDGDDEYADALMNYSIQEAETWANIRQHEIAATVAIAGKARIDERIADAPPGSELEESLLESSTVLVEFLADSVDDDSEVRHGFATDFGGLVGAASDDPGRSSPASVSPGRSASAPSGRAPPASPVDGLSHPHVSTAQAQHDETLRGTWLDSASSEEDEPEAARAAAGAVAAEAARENKYTTVEKRQMDRLNPGTLGAPAVPLRTAAFVTKLTENLEDAPRVAALVQRGLLKTSDVMNPVYVQAMEKRLREQEITKEVEGRDARYRPRTARQAYRPPVNVVPVGQPGVYRYRRPRFAQPQFSQPVQNA